jgi:hypothetical protein
LIAQLTTAYTIFRRTTLLSLLTTSALLLICFTYRETSSWREWGELHPTSGTWIATASDASHGLLYRPLDSPLGYGGTRYGPVRTLAQAFLLRAGMGPIHSTFFVGIASMALLLTATFFLMRQMQTPPAFAAALTCTLLAAGGARLAFLAGLSDVLAAGLNFSGLIAINSLVADPSRPRKILTLLIASTLFVLAAFTKITSIFGITAAFFWLLLKGRRRPAFQLAMIFLAEVFVAFLVTEYDSDGRFLSVFRASALAGGNLSGLAGAPDIFFGKLFRADPIAGGFWMAGVTAALFVRPRMQLSTLLLIITTLATIPIFGTPGTDINHLLDLEVASLLCVAVWFNSGRVIATMPVALVIVATLCACQMCVREAGGIERDSPRRQALAALTDAAKSSATGPLLSENPLLPVLAGERPYLLDGFMFAGFTAKDPDLASHMFDDLDHQRFRAVILAPSRGLPEANIPATFTHEVMPHLSASYELIATDGRYLVYLPRLR